jgi:hypothetical protein
MPVSMPFEQILAKARLRTPEYTREELVAAQARLAEAAAMRHIMSGALTFDDATSPDLWCEPVRPGRWEPGHRGETEDRERLDAADDLRHLCKIVITQANALQTMSAFVSGSVEAADDPSRILEPEGARVLACVLHLAAREDSARFWWQFASGADDGEAKFCLFLHHLALGEVQEANWWHDQIPRRGKELWARAVREGRDRETAAAATCLQAVARRKTVPDEATAVVGYVRSAVRFVDDSLDLPLPADGFAAKIEEMTGGRVAAGA